MTKPGMDWKMDPLTDWFDFIKKLYFSIVDLFLLI